MFDGRLNEFCETVHAESKSKGWYSTPKNVGEMLLLVISELTEAFEEYRSGHGFSETYHKTDAQGHQKPEGFPIELADAVIRLGDLASHLGIDLEHAIDVKRKYNATRPYRHGGKLV